MGYLRARREGDAADATRQWKAAVRSRPRSLRWALEWASVGSEWGRLRDKLYRGVGVLVLLLCLGILDLACDNCIQVPENLGYHVLVACLAGIIFASRMSSMVEDNMAYSCELIFLLIFFFR